MVVGRRRDIFRLRPPLVPQTSNKLDRFVRRTSSLLLWQIADIAGDAVECCSLARRLALRLTDGLEIGATSMADTVAGTIGGTGEDDFVKSLDIVAG